LAAGTQRSVRAAAQEVCASKAAARRRCIRARARAPELDKSAPLRSSISAAWE